MMKQKELIFSLAQRRGLMNDNSNGLVDQSTVESLKGFLQEMSTTIQSLAIRHNSVCQKYKRIELSNADSHIPSAGGVSLPSHETPVSHQWCYADGVMMNGLRLRNLAFQAQELMISQSDQSRVSATATSGRCNGCSQQGMYRAQEMKSMDMDIGMGSEQVSRKWHPERSFQKLPIDDVTVDEFQSFLEEMKNTIQIWSRRHRSLVQGCQLGKKNTEVVAPHSDMASTSCVEPPRGNALQISPQIQEDKAVVNTVQPASSPAFNQNVTEGGIADPPYTPLHFCESKKSPEFVSCMVPGNSQQSSDDKEGALSIASQLTLGIFHGQGEPKKCVSHHGSMTAAQPSTSSCRVHRVVESPDWLPYGWITEVKTRANGSSAGTKDKYYFDPISKRRFRSRKEVFCFLTTGNSGRYKPRPKALSNEGESNRDPTPIAQAQPTSTSYQLLTGQMTPLHFRFLPYYSSPSMAGPLPFFHASGFYRNFLLPFKPSQPSEGLMHERWFDVPTPMSEHFQCNGIEKEAYRLYEHCTAGPNTDPLYHNGVTATVYEGRLKHCVPGLYTFREGHNWADLTGVDGGIANSTNFSERSWQTEQSQPSGFAVSHGMVNSQAAASQLLEKKETRNLEADARFSSRHGDLYALKLPARKLKKVKSHGKEGLEALGKVICQQGLTILKGSKN